MAVQNMSEAVYVGMCHEIGTPQLVTSRRDMLDIMELLQNEKRKCSMGIMMHSGSYREGFRLRGSDIDFMFWPTNYQVIFDFSQSLFYNLHRQALIFCDSSGSPPGFTLLFLLWQPFESATIDVLSSCVRLNGRIYISSSEYRETTCFNLTPNARVHGPCSSGTYGSGEYDNARCFVSDFWPPSASSWIGRCHSWPPPSVVSDIVRNGCHFVAIGHKLGNYEEDEWRISFSLAEFKLVYSMNHTQLLTYGLLKLFLKEIINNELRDEDKLLCSYHMKTAIFWVIQQNILPNWCPQSLLDGFWICFRLILKWVYEGSCQNFFIPENNMFLGKIHGQAQTSLFRRLYGLYEKGIALLLHSPSIRSSIIDVLCNPRLVVCTNEHTLISEADFDLELFDEISNDNVMYAQDLHNCITILHTLVQLIGSPLTEYQILGLQRHTVTIFQCTAFILHNIYSNTSVNKKMYLADKISSRILKLTVKFGCVSDMLYVAMYYYKTLRYRKALSVIEMTKVKLAQPYLMHCGRGDRERYTEAVGGQSWSNKIRQAIADNIKLFKDICYINELLPEQQCSSQNLRPFLYIPPFVLLHMLEFLSYRHVDTMRARTALHDLEAHVHHEHRLYISWEILGICQHMAGYVQAALYSYQQSLREDTFNEIQNVTAQRINSLQL